MQPSDHEWREGRELPTVPFTVIEVVTKGNTGDPDETEHYVRVPDDPELMGAYWRSLYDGLLWKVTDDNRWRIVSEPRSTTTEWFKTVGTVIVIGGVRWVAVPAFALTDTKKEAQ